MKGCAAEINSGAMTKTADDVRMPNPIERYRFVLKILYQRMFKGLIGSVLQEHVQSFDYHRLGSVIGSGVVVRNVDLRIAAAPETFDDVIATIQPALL